MKRSYVLISLFVISVLFISLCSDSYALLSTHPTTAVMVKFKGGYSFHQNPMIHKLSLQYIQSPELQKLGIRVLNVSEYQKRQLQKLPDIDFIEDDEIATSQWIPNDPLETSQYSLELTRVTQAWDIVPAKQVLVAVVDSGIQHDHPDLYSKIGPGYNLIDRDEVPQDDYGHGTHVSGIIGAATNNSEGISGIGLAVQIMPIKVLDNNGSGKYSNIAEGIVYAADHGAKIINLSLGGTKSSKTLEKAVDYAWQKGAVIVAASGNLGSEIKFYPAAYDNVIAVSSTNSNESLMTSSNYGE